MSRFDDPKDLKDSKNEKIEIKGHTKNDELDKIDKEYKETGDAMRALQAKKEAGNGKYDEAHKIGRKPEPVKTQSSAVEPEIIDPEEGRKAVEGFLKLLKADHTSYKSSFLSDSVLDVIKLSKLEDAMPWLSDKEFGHHILKVENGNVYIEEELFDSFSKERQAQLEEECNKQDLQLYVNSRG